jgi:hypothetical protein
MKYCLGLSLAGWMLVGAAGPAGAAGCQTVEDMTENFMNVYPTGGHAARFDGERGDKVMEGLDIKGDGDEVLFLYSGHGPTTGARGRYMYLILDEADCILDSDWVDGDTFDRLSPSD